MAARFGSCGILAFFSISSLLAVEAARLESPQCPPSGFPTASLLIGAVIGGLGVYYVMKNLAKGAVPLDVGSDAPGSVTLALHADSQTRGLPKEKYGCHEDVWPVRSEQFRTYMAQMVELIVEYVRKPHKYKVLTDHPFGFVYESSPKEMPERPDEFHRILQDVYEKLLPHNCHWQHPQFHGYFGTGFSYPDILGDCLASGLSVIPYAWIGSPSLAELEMVVLNWFGKAIGLHEDMLFAANPSESKGGGIISYSSSEIIFVCLMAARTKILAAHVSPKDPERREKEARLLPKLVAYTNKEAHSAIEKACLMAMIRLRTVTPDRTHFGLTGELLERAIKKDVANGLIPFYIHGSLGTTNTTAVDKIDELGELAKKYGCWFHLDAAYGGGALLCPEYRHLAKGIEMVDSTNVNMHKMLLCSVPMSFLWSRRKVDMENAFAVYPAYLRAKNAEVAAFRHWGIQLSRRSLALKGWFVMRMFGLKGMQEHVRRMVRMADRFRELIAKDERFEMVGKPILTLAAFRLRGEHTKENGQHTMELCDFLNRSHRIFVTHARPMGIDVIRVNISFNLTTEADIDESYAIISQLTDEFLAERPQFSSLRFMAREATPIAGSPATPRTDPTNSPLIKRAVSPPSSSVKAVSPKSLRAARSKVDRNNN